MTSSRIDRSTLEALRDDPVLFAEHLIGEPLWSHQVELVRSQARIRAVCSGRQAGKSRALAVEALHTAFAIPGALVLILSAGEDAAKALLAEVSALAASPLLAGSVTDDGKSEMRLSNRSVIRSVPASQKQVRGRSVDLLIIDEACFIDEELWTAARYSVIARPGSRVLMASTPWGAADRFFAVTYRAGEGGAEGYASFHWPSTASPLVDRELLGMWRATSTDREYRAEVLAEWVDSTGAYFSSAELEAAVAHGWEMVDPRSARGWTVTAGVDWGFARDASALCCLGRVPEPHPLAGLWAVAYAAQAFGRPYAQWIEDVAQVGSHRGGLRFGKVVAETNGVGQMPTYELQRRLGQVVAPVATTARLKEGWFGSAKLAMQRGELALPRHPELLKQLAALEYEMTDSGSMRIAVPERGGGHDDLAMAFAFAWEPELVAAAEPPRPRWAAWNYRTNRPVGLTEAQYAAELGEEEYMRLRLEEARMGGYSWLKGRR